MAIRRTRCCCRYIWHAKKRFCEPLFAISIRGQPTISTARPEVLSACCLPQCQHRSKSRHAALNQEQNVSISAFTCLPSCAVMYLPSSDHAHVDCERRRESSVRPDRRLSTRGIFASMERVRPRIHHVRLVRKCPSSLDVIRSRSVCGQVCADGRTLCNFQTCLLPPLPNDKTS